MKHLFCSCCGVKFPYETWPRQCVSCEHIEWKNPTPVTVVLQTVKDDVGTVGFVVGKRAIEPKKGHWSLISGYMNVDETAEESIKREFKEETCLELADEPKYVMSVTTGDLIILCFVVTEPLSHHTVFNDAKPCHENEDISVSWLPTPVPLAFPLQDALVQKCITDGLLTF